MLYSEAMSALLDLVAQAAANRKDAESEFRSALEAARSEHTLAQIAAAAELTPQGVRYLLKRGDK
jgi:hypothetical protein